MGCLGLCHVKVPRVLVSFSISVLPAPKYSSHPHGPRWSCSRHIHIPTSRIGGDRVRVGVSELLVHLRKCPYRRCPNITTIGNFYLYLIDQSSVTWSKSSCKGIWKMYSLSGQLSTQSKLLCLWKRRE